MVIGFIKKIFHGRKKKSSIIPQLLSGLPEGYVVFNDILYNDSDINYVVFSREQGLFLINSLPDKGELTSSGQHLFINKKPRPHAIKKTLKDTFWLKSTIRERIGLDVDITPIAVFENARVKVAGPLIGVIVTQSDRLIDLIVNAPEKKRLEDGVVIVLRELHGVRSLSYRGA